MWNCVQYLQPTMEIILYSWSMSLEYSVGTSSFAINAMTAAAEAFGFRLSDYFRKAPTSDECDKVEEEASKKEQQYAQTGGVRAEVGGMSAPMSAQHVANTQPPAMDSFSAQFDEFDPRPVGPASAASAASAADAAGCGGGRLVGNKKQPKKRLTQDPDKANQTGTLAGSERVTETSFAGMMSGNGPTMREVWQRHEFLKNKRKETSMYRLQCQKSAQNSGKMRNPMKQSESICAQVSKDKPSKKSAASKEQQGPRNEGPSVVAEMEVVNVEEEEDVDNGLPPPVSMNWERIRKHPYHHTCAGEGRGPEKCKLGKHEDHNVDECPYCSDVMEIEDATRNATVTESAQATSASKIFPTFLEGSMLYATQALLQWCKGSPVSIKHLSKKAAHLGTSKTVQYREKGQAEQGHAAQYDLAWLSNKGRRGNDQGWSRHSFASTIVRSQAEGVKIFGFHIEGLRTSSTCASEDNQRGVPRSRRAEHQDKAFVADGGSEMPNART